MYYRRIAIFLTLVFSKLMIMQTEKSFLFLSRTLLSNFFNSFISQADFSLPWSFKKSPGGGDYETNRDTRRLTYGCKFWISGLAEGVPGKTLNSQAIKVSFRVACKEIEKNKLFFQYFGYFLVVTESLSHTQIGHWSP